MQTQYPIQTNIHAFSKLDFQIFFVCISVPLSAKGLIIGQNFNLAKPSLQPDDVNLKNFKLFIFYLAEETEISKVASCKNIRI